VKSDWKKHDFHLIKQDPDFDLAFFLPPSEPRVSRDEAIRTFIRDWTADSSRKPFSGFNPQVYAELAMSQQELEKRNPLAHFIEKGKPRGPWIIPLIRDTARTPRATQLRTAMHVHAYYPEFIEELLRCIEGNISRCDLFVTTSRTEDLENLKRSLSSYNRGQVRISVVPNRGRDIGPFLTEYDWLDDKYDLLGHLHCKKTPHLDAEFGQTWRRFLWRNLIGEGRPMMDVIAKCFEDDSELGLVFPDDPNIFGWMTNKEPVAGLAKKMKLTIDLPRAFDFPVGTMFWCRPAALRPLFDLGLTWNQYPLEPIPSDGTILHAIERLIPFIARHEGYRVAATNVGGVTRGSRGGFQ
jgi:lipopolysaccharide biosynthesis protein